MRGEGERLEHITRALIRSDASLGAIKTMHSLSAERREPPQSQPQVGSTAAILMFVALG